MKGSGQKTSRSTTPPKDKQRLSAALKANLARRKAAPRKPITAAAK